MYPWFNLASARDIAAASAICHLYHLCKAGSEGVPYEEYEINATWYDSYLKERPWSRPPPFSRLPLLPEQELFFQFDIFHVMHKRDCGRVCWLSDHHQISTMWFCKPLGNIFQSTVCGPSCPFSANLEIWRYLAPTLSHRLPWSTKGWPAMAMCWPVWAGSTMEYQVFARHMAFACTWLVWPVIC